MTGGTPTEISSRISPTVFITAIKPRQPHNQNENSKNKNKTNSILMSTTRGVLAQSSEPEVRDKVLENNPDQIGIWKCWFLRKGENGSTRKKISRSKDENQQHSNHV